MSKPVLDRQFLLSHPAHFIALGFGSGLARKAPGTWGTLVGFPLWWIAQRWLGIEATWLLALVLFCVGVWACQVTSQHLGVADHGGVVIDEIAAFALVLCFTPATPLWWLVAFVLFRLFDILKPWPIYLFDRHVKGGIGVMLDDFVAALATIACVVFLRQLV